jgi:predicted secreted protein with PEFG-CTERM motif
MVFLAVTILSVSALGQNAYAAVGMSLNVDADFSGGSISISGDTDRSDAVTIKVNSENGNLVAIAQASPSGGNYSATVGLPSMDGAYTVSASQGDASKYSLSVQVSASEASAYKSTIAASSTGSTTSAVVTSASSGGLSITAGGVQGSTTIDVSGTTDRADDITLKVIAPNGNVITTAQLSPSGGSFMTTIETGGALWNQDGMYTISAYQGAPSKYQASAEVEVVDGHVIPEFGTIAVMILVVAIVSIIIVSAKTKLSLVPKY